MKKRILFLLLPFLFFSYLFSQERGFQVIAKTGDGETLKLYKGCYALVIGISDYLSGWPDLPNAARDADEIGNMLSDLGFQVTKIKDAARDEMIQVLDSFVYGPGGHKENCLIIFFAGHGHTERMSYGDDMGYIVPKDAPLPTRDKAGFMKKAIDMQTIEAYTRRIQAKHALLLFDSCFSGAIFDMARAIPADISYKTERPVRQFITAGEADEEVPDKSIFKSQIIEGLGGEADRNNDGYVTGTELGDFLQEKVVKYSNRRQHPQYGKIRDSRLDKGDFVFKLTSKPEETEKLPELAEPKIALKPKYGSLEINVDISDAKVYLDGELKGTTKKGYDFVINGLLVGSHTIRISHEKYKGYIVPVRIYSDKLEKLTPKLVPIGQSVQKKPIPQDFPSIKKAQKQDINIKFEIYMTGGTILRNLMESIYLSPSVLFRVSKNSRIGLRYFYTPIEKVAKDPPSFRDIYGSDTNYYGYLTSSALFVNTKAHVVIFLHNFEPGFKNFKFSIGTGLGAYIPVSEYVTCSYKVYYEGFDLGYHHEIQDEISGISLALFTSVGIKWFFLGNVGLIAEANYLRTVDHDGFFGGGLIFRF